MAALSRLLFLGQVESIGVSNFSIDLLELGGSFVGEGRIISNQLRYSLFDRRIEKVLFPYCQRKGIKVIAYSPLGQNFRKKLKEKRASVIFDLSDEIGCSPSQLVLSWLLSHPGVIPIPKANKVEHFRENWDSQFISLTEDQISRLEEVYPIDDE